MNSWKDEAANGPSARRRAAAQASKARQVAQAVADREEGRRRLNTATVSVSLASVAAAGVIIAVLPGSTHAAVTPAGSNSSSGSSSSSNSGSGSSGGSNSSSSNNQGGIQAPANPPQVSNGGGGFGSTSGGT
jgi:hypothetical protein